MSSTDESTSFFWEIPEARRRLREATKELQDRPSQKEEALEQRRFIVKRLDESASLETVQDSTAAKWLDAELNEHRFRGRKWQNRYDRLEASGAGDHRVPISQ